ncbi:MAG: hypothetical protein P4L67_03865 [Candidatus Pacebacteria bacterium]|nr:hypothetical protein [Candidatus Paceibacterota bacterium]
MSIHIRTWGIALTAMVAFAVPHLVTQAIITQDPAAKAAIPAPKTLNLKVTAYTSVEEETDDTPFITADGSYVHDGVVATNLLPFGTKVIIPSLFGDKVFTVDDRMSKRLMNNIDIWMDSKADALIFGAHIAKIVVLQDSAVAMAAVSPKSVSDEAVAMATKAMITTATGSRSQGPSVRQL